MIIAHDFPGDPKGTLRALDISASDPQKPFVTTSVHIFEGVHVRTAEVTLAYTHTDAAGAQHYKVVVGSAS